MLKFLAEGGKQESFLYSKVIPRVGEVVLKNGLYYRVRDVIYDDDEGDIIVKVIEDVSMNGVDRAIESVPQGVMEYVHSLLREGSKLSAVKALKEAAQIGLREAKDYCNKYSEAHLF